jgi:uncharacterized protein YkwD
VQSRVCCLGRLPFWSLALLIIVMVWTTPAFSMAESNGVVISFGAESSGASSLLDVSECIDGGSSSEFIIPISFSSDPLPGCPTSFERQVIFFINYERSLIGLKPLELDVRLQTAARWMSDDMANRDLVPDDHVDSLGRTFDVRVVEESGYPYVHLGEVIAGGFPLPKDVVQAWMNSPGHRSRLLDENYSHIGVGYTFDPSTDHWFYWTADLGSTIEGREAPLAGCDPGFYLLFLSKIQK